MIAQAFTLVLFYFSYRHKRGRLRHRRGLLILGLHHLLDITLLRGEQGIPHDSARLPTRAFLCSEFWARVGRRAPALFRQYRICHLCL